MELLSPDHLERWTAALPDSPVATLLTPHTDVSFTVAVTDGPSARIRLAPGELSVGPDTGDSQFQLVAEAEDWEKFFRLLPPPLFHSVFAMRMRVPGFSIRGDEHRFAQCAAHVRRALEAGRRAANPGAPEPAPAEWVIDRSGIQGRYVDIEVLGRRTSVYVESAGSGRDLLLLHTAGSDGRQNHPLLADPRLASRFRITTFDLPGHGRSEMTPGQYDGAYSLGLDAYRQAVLGVVNALGLSRPILSGASMAGQICLEMAISAPEVFGGIVACEASDHVPGRRTEWIGDPTIDTALFAPEWIHGLLAPSSPDPLKQLVLWTYSQGGYGTFAGDIDFYSGGWDARDRIHRADTAVTPLVLMTGEYDYSCTPAMSQETAAKIAGAHYWTMPGLGHFPLAENPDLFVPHLLRAVDAIDAARGGPAR